MRGSVWVALIRQIPPEQQDQYMLTTRSGVEIAIQSFIRIEADLVIFKGRLSGSQEAGRIFFLPYENIDFFGTANPMRDADFNETFGSLVLPRSEDARDEPAHVNGEAPPTAVSPSRPGSSHNLSSSIRSEVLERFRSRPPSSLNLPSPTAQGRPPVP
jgi:hypothetical protein